MIIRCKQKDNTLNLTINTIDLAQFSVKISNFNIADD